MTAPDVISVDGLLDDWGGVKGTALAGGTAGDAGGTVRCNYDETTLYLSVAVTDERLIRSKKPAPADDHLTFTFGDARLDVFPADTEKGTKAAVRMGDGKSSKHFKVVDSLTKTGWSVELAVARAKLPGGANAQMIPFEAELHDSDLAVDKKPQAVLSTGAGGAIVFEEAASMFDTFLEQNRLKRSDLTVDVMADVDGETGRERVVAGGKVIAVIGREYSYIELPVAKPKDVLEVRVVDLAGQGKSSLLVRYIERGGGGSREILAIWNVKSDASFTRTFAHELSKQLGKSRLTNKWELLPPPPPKKKAKKPKGLELVITPGDVVGFTQETWAEIPADDMLPILLPWGPAKREIYRFHDDEFSGGAE